LITLGLSSIENRSFTETRLRVVLSQVPNSEHLGHPSLLVCSLLPAQVLGGYSGGSRGRERFSRLRGGCAGPLEGGVAAVEGIVGLLPVEDLLDGEDLQLGVGGAVDGFVESGLGGFLEHGFGWGFENRGRRRSQLSRG